jgi:hypothetical protein
MQNHSRAGISRAPSCGPHTQAICTSALTQPYLGIGQMSESLACLQGLQELHYGGDTTLGQQHAAQAAKATEGLLQLGCWGACWEVLGQTHGLASLCCGLGGGSEEGMNTHGTIGEGPQTNTTTDPW